MIMVLMETEEVWKKDYYVQEEDGKLIVNTVYKEGNQYVQHVRNEQS